MIERVSKDAADEDVLISVIIVVANGNRGIVTGACESRFFSHVGKCSIAIISEQPVRVFWRGLFQARDIGAVGEENVQISVIVIVEDGNTSSHRLRDVPLRGFATVQREGDREGREMDGCLDLFRGGCPLLLREQCGGRQQD